MPIQREFLDWRSSALGAAAEYLRARCQREPELDLSQFIVVIPSGRAGRRLLEILVALAEERKLLLTPPEIVTPEKFPELLYEAKWPLADTLSQQLAWTAALRSAPPSVLKSFLPFPPDPNDWPRWLAVAETLRRLHVELAADGLNCREVLARGESVEGFVEHSRWQALCELQQLYLKTLDRLQLWDVQTARLVAIKQREIATDKQIILLGTVDLNRAQRQMLDQIAGHVTALVVAPPQMQDRFDAHGCLVPSQWTQTPLPLADDQIERVDGPAEQAEAVTRWLASLNGRYRADEIAIGLPDDKLGPQVERQLVQYGLAGRFGAGRPLAETGPYRLIKAAAEYAARRRYRDLAALVRHPHVYQRIATAGGQRGQETGASRDDCFLDALDRYAAERLPARLDPERLAKDEKAAAVFTLYGRVENLVAPLSGPSRPLADWAAPLRELLTAVYGQRLLDRNEVAERDLFIALESFSAALDGLSLVPPALQPSVDVRQAVQVFLGGLASESIPPPAEPDAIELLGWLDLPLDDAPAVIVTTFNEGLVPSSLTADAFLPNRLREALGLVHNDRRLARDAYALSLLIASRRDLKLIVAHRDTEGNPLAPSRLLFLTDPERLIHRALAFFRDPPHTPNRRKLLLPQAAAPRSRSRLAPPKPQPLAKPITELSVTKFRDFLACPYRFYLRHLLALESRAENADELNGGAFGELVHKVLANFGRSEEAKEVRTTADSKKIADYLDYQLDRQAAGWFGPKQARPAVVVQLEQIRLRLHAFSVWQAARAHEGWRIVFSEDAEDKKAFTAPFKVDEIAFTLRGRIDRIDFHETLGRLAVLDYKTADRGDAPHRTHRHGEEWIDLQLPLYRHLVRTIKLAATVPADAPIELGYVLLPLDLKCVGLALAEWDDAMLLSADLKAMEVVRALRDQQFPGPCQPPPDFFDDLAAICQDRSLGVSFLAEGDAT